MNVDHSSYALVTFTLKASATPIYLVVQVPCTFYDKKGSWWDGMPEGADSVHIAKAVELITEASSLSYMNDYVFNNVQYFNDGVEVNMEGATN